MRTYEDTYIQHTYLTSNVCLPFFGVPTDTHTYATCVYIYTSTYTYTHTDAHGIHIYITHTYIDAYIHTYETT